MAVNLLQRSLTKTPNPQIPIDSELANIHLRLEGDDDLQLLSHEVYLKAAAEWAEGVTQRTLLVSDHVWVLYRFPRGDREIILPRGITQSVESLEYYDTSGLVTLTGPSSTVPGTDYQEDLSSPNGGRLQPPVGESWPSVDTNYLNPVTIRYKAGWNTQKDVPADIQNAVLVYAADRLEMPTGGDAQGNAEMAEGLLSAWKLDYAW